MGLRNAMLFVKDLRGMTAFYSDVLGLTPNQSTRLENWWSSATAAFRCTRFRRGSPRAFRSNNVFALCAR
jgi:catechol 2,3-dioxygenase-like lactoylglutathione lyase family enzyme